MYTHFNTLNKKRSSNWAFFILCIMAKKTKICDNLTYETINGIIGNYYKYNEVLKKVKSVKKAYFIALTTK